MKNIKNVLITILLVLLTFTCNIYSVKAMTDDNIDNDYESIDILEEDSIDISLDEVNISIPLKVSARNAIAIDAESNQVLWNQNAYEIVPMASTTKILTALIAINYGDLDR